MLEFRVAERKDTGVILDFINRLAEYEKMTDDVVATEALLEEWIFDRKKANVLFALQDGKEVGIALYFYNFSTFLGRAGIYLEDLFVLPEYRGKGYGKGLLKSWRRLLWRKAAGGWNGPAWTGISRASIFIYLWVRCQWMNGPATD